MTANVANTAILTDPWGLSSFMQGISHNPCQTQPFATQRHGRVAAASESPAPKRKNHTGAIEKAVSQ
jgi:hypothetical protein